MTTSLQRPLTPAGGTPAADRLKWLPGLRTLLSYQPAWLPRDLVAGLVLTALLVPAGMGYAEASGLPAIYGLYATIVPLIAYALFAGRILVLGPDSSLAPLIAAAIIPLAAGATRRGGRPCRLLAVLSAPCACSPGLPASGSSPTAVQARTLRLHERDRPDRPVEPAAQAVRVLHGRRRRDPRGAGFVGGVADGETNRAALIIGVLCLAGDPGLQALAAADPGGARRRGRRDRRGRRLRPG